MILGKEVQPATLRVPLYRNSRIPQGLPGGGSPTEIVPGRVTVELSVKPCGAGLLLIGRTRGRIGKRPVVTPGIAAQEYHVQSAYARLPQPVSSISYIPEQIPVWELPLGLLFIIVAGYTAISEPGFMICLKKRSSNEPHRQLPEYQNPLRVVREMLFH